MLRRSVFASRRIAAVHTAARLFASRRFTEDHEWAEAMGDGTARIGISDYAQHALGDVVFVELPALATRVSQKEQIGAVESVKAASDIYSPVSGEVLEVNEALVDKPGLVNRETYSNGWLCRVKLSNADEMEGLMDEEAYKKYTE